MPSPEADHLARPGGRFTVMGLGRFGGGAGVVRWLKARGVDVTVSDRSAPEALAEIIAALDAAPGPGRIAWHLGGHDRVDFTDVDAVVVNPAVPKPWDNPYLAAARAAGVPLTTEIRLVWSRLDLNRVIAVTGTAGKSTTTAMIHHALAASGRTAHVGGNLGGSLLPALDAIGPHDAVVLELSSAMLYWLGPDGPDAPPWRPPHVAVLTNLAPNHLDWHGTDAHYRRCKLTLLDGAPHVVDARDQTAPPVPIALALPGAHNQTNAWTAARAIGAFLALDPADAAPLLADFRGLPDRLELIARDGARCFYNDSKSTVPEATVLAIDAFADPRRVHVIAGGYDKGVPLDAIARRAPDLGGLYTIGATGSALADAAQRAGATSAVCVEILDDAVRAAVARMGPADVLVLSPGCASWDQFENYERRGAAFRAAVARATRGRRRSDS